LPDWHRPNYHPLHGGRRDGALVSTRSISGSLTSRRVPSRGSSGRQPSCASGAHAGPPLVTSKEDERDKAEKKREALLDLLEQKDWLLPRDVLKTSLILERVRR